IPAQRRRRARRAVRGGDCAGRVEARLRWSMAPRYPLFRCHANRDRRGRRPAESVEHPPRPAGSAMVWEDRFVKAESLDFSHTVCLLASPQAVWRALVDPDLIPRWFAGTRAESSWLVGAPIEWSGNVSGYRFRGRSTILQVEPQRLLQFDHWANISHQPD